MNRTADRRPRNAVHLERTAFFVPGHARLLSVRKQELQSLLPAGEGGACIPYLSTIPAVGGRPSAVDPEVTP